MFDVTSGILNEVLLPNGLIERPDGSSESWRHADCSDARKHYAGMIVVDRKRRPVGDRIKFRNAEVTLTTPSDDKTRFLQNPFAHLAHLDEIVNGNSSTNIKRRSFSSPNTDPRLAARFVSRAGTLIPRSRSAYRWRFTERYHPKHGHSGKRLALAPTLELDTVSAQLSVAERGSTPPRLIDLQDGYQVVIYNYDEEEADFERLTRREKGSVPLCDDDFKWLYQLLEEPQGGWKAWIERGVDEDDPSPKGFPAPDRPVPAMLTVVGRGPKAKRRPAAVEVSTCFGSTWGK